VTLDLNLTQTKTQSNIWHSWH